MKKTIFLFLFFSLSCNSEPTFETEEEGKDLIQEEIQKEPDESPNDKEPQSSGFSFPSSVDGGNCTEPAIAAEFCDWGLAAYDVVLLEVSSVELVDSPIVDEVTRQVVQTCDDSILPGLKIKGRVQLSVNGLSGDISIVIGDEQMDRWNSQPYRDAAGNMKWFSDTSRILPGDSIGLTLHKNPDTGTLGILGEHFFDIDEEQKIRFADTTYECEEPDPKKVAGNTFSELKQQLQKCAKTTSSDDRIRQKAAAWDYRSFADLGVCLTGR